MSFEETEKASPPISTLISLPTTTTKTFSVGDKQICSLSVESVFLVVRSPQSSTSDAKQRSRQAHLSASPSLLLLPFTISPSFPPSTMHVSRSAQLLLLSPFLLAVFVMSLSGLPGRQGLGDTLRTICSPSASGFSPPLLFAPQGIRIDWGPILTAPQQLSCQLVTLFEASAWVSGVKRAKEEARAEAHLLV